jgi:putative phage-type endonuclease
MQQNTPEWLEMRRSKIGASDAPIILGLSPWKTPFQLWEEKVLGKEQQTSAAMARGHALEDQARECFEKLTGIITMPKVVVHAERTWQMASLDGVTFDGTTIVEIKCPNKETHALAEKGIIPDHYMAQVQHQLSVTGAAKAFYFSYSGERGSWVEIFADEKFISKMLKAEEKFYNLMLSKEPPDLIERDYVIVDTVKALSLAEEYEEIKTQADILYQAAEKVKDDLKEVIGNRNAFVGKLKITKSFMKGRVDHSVIPELSGVDLEKYRKPPCEKWTFTIKDDLES